MKACKGPRVSAMPLQFGSEVQLQQSTTMFPNTLKIKIKGYFTILKLKKKNIIYVYTPFEHYFSKCPILLDYSEIDSNQIKFITGQI